mmetsp:Transcript_36855/g.101406  ORF Transcript_36855/g.101406 Transcript_36855/m.101406 type:complete len:265 (+) Transcript_36855:101-895(+)
MLRARQRLRRRPKHQRRGVLREGPTRWPLPQPPGPHFRRLSDQNCTSRGRRCSPHPAPYRPAGRVPSPRIWRRGSRRMWTSGSRRSRRKGMRWRRQWRLLQLRQAQNPYYSITQTHLGRLHGSRGRLRFPTPHASQHPTTGCSSMLIVKAVRRQRLSTSQVPEPVLRCLESRPAPLPPRKPLLPPRTSGPCEQIARLSALAMQSFSRRRGREAPSISSPTLRRCFPRAVLPQFPVLLRGADSRSPLRTRRQPTARQRLYSAPWN